MKGSSDPYYVLSAKVPPAYKGQEPAVVQLAKSKTVMHNLNPDWEVVEVGAARLYGVRAVKLQVFDYDAITKDDLIGEATLLLPDLGALLAQGRTQLVLNPAPKLVDPRKKDKKNAPPCGAVEVCIQLVPTPGSVVPRRPSAKELMAAPPAAAAPKSAAAPKKSVSLPPGPAPERQPSLAGLVAGAEPPKSMPPAKPAAANALDAARAAVPSHPRESVPTVTRFTAESLLE